MSFWPSKWKSASALAWRLVTRASGRRPDSEIYELFGRLRAAELNLQQASGELETHFLATSSDLEFLSQSSDKFVAQVETLVGIATGKNCDEMVFSGAIELIKQATLYLVNCQEETERMLEALRSYSAQIEQLLGAELELQRAMMPLKFVQTLFRSESAPLGAGIQQMFSALTEEMEVLHDQVRDIFGTKFKQLLQTQSTIERVTTQLDRQARSLREITTTHRAQIESSLENLKKELAANQQRDIRLRRLSKDFANEVGQVVMGLQFQDIVSQKLQHVAAALPEIEKRFAESGAVSKSESPGRAFQVLHQSCRLEAGQLEAAQKELAGAEVAIVGGVQKVLAHVAEMDSQCLSLEEFKKLTTSFDGTVQDLVEMIGEVRDLVSTTVASASEVYETLRPIGGLASDLTANVRAMSARIHLIGLNAQIQAAQASQDSKGTGLEVLSARTNEISGETNRISEQAAERLDALVAGLAGRVKAFEQMRSDGLAQETVLNEQGRSEERQLHGVRDSALRTLNEIGNSLDEIREKAGQALADVHFAEFHQVTIPDLQEPLTAIADRAEKWLRARNYDLAQDNLVGEFQRDYTMASERAVFEGIVPAAKPDIDFFADSPGDANPPPGGGTLEPAPASVPAVAPDPDSLGANAELF